MVASRPIAKNVSAMKAIYETSIGCVVSLLGMGGILFRGYCFGGENSLGSAPNSASSAKKKTRCVGLCTQIIG